MGYHLNLIKNDGKSFVLNDIKTALQNNTDFELQEKDKVVKIVSKKEENDLVAFYHNGMIWSEKYTVELIIFLLKLSSILDARVRGDEFETYKTSTKTFIHPEDIELIKKANEINQKVYQRGKYKSFLVYVLIMLAFVVIGLLIRE